MHRRLTAVKPLEVPAPLAAVAVAGALVLLALALPAAARAAEAAGQPDAAALYERHCAACHGADRLGGIGPALLPSNLRRLRKARAGKVISNGLPATQMPAFGEVLDDQAVSSLVSLIYSAPATAPVWQAGDITATHVRRELPPLERPVFDADPLNLFVVVEAGDHHVTILDGDRLEPIHRFRTRYALHGGPKFSPDGRYTYLASRDGWITKYDLYGLRVIAEIRAGINTRNLAVSADGRFVAVANYLPHTLVLLDADTLALLDVIEVRGEGGDSSRVSAVYDAPPRNSFVVALKDVPELWEVSYAQAGFPVRRVALDDYLDDFFFVPDYTHLIGAARNEHNGQVVDLDAGRKVADIDLPGLPHLGSGISWMHEGRPVVATPNLKSGEVSIIDMQTWQTIRRIETLGPGFFMRSHENSAYAFVDVFFGPNKDAVHVIDKQTLEIVKTLRPAPGKTAAHVEFTRDGRYALLSIWDDDGALVVYDARTLEEVKRLPMRKPSGKYNVWNKISGSTGTSH